MKDGYKIRPLMTWCTAPRSNSKPSLNPKSLHPFLLSITVHLAELQFSEFVGGSREWILGPTTFEKINLIVGRNASGKTRLLNVIGGLSTLLLGTQRQLWQSGSYKVKFGDEDGSSAYQLSIQDQEVASERYIVADQTVLERRADGRGELNATQLADQKLRFESPKDQLAAVLKRDAIQHPFLQKLYDWSVGVKHYRFGTTMGSDRVVITGLSPQMVDTSQPRAAPTIQSKSPEAQDPNQVFQIYVDGFTRFGVEFDSGIIKDMKSLDYQITEVGYDPLERNEFQGSPIPPQVLFVQERDLACKTRQMEMSSGMYRALNMAIQLNYWEKTKSSVCILIDDIGEGLDFDRSTRLIKLLIAKAKTNAFQLIMTTNDRFVMNSVPLEYWGIIERKRNKVKVLNERNSPEAFADFKSIGLNNFDFFSRTLYRKAKNK